MFRFVEKQPALIIQTETEKILLASDLHIGYEKGLADKGVKIPSLTPRLNRKIESVIVEEKPSRIILIGDIKHGTSRLLPHEWRDVPEFFERLLTRVEKIEVVPGNHDGGLKALLPPTVKIHTARGMVIQSRGKATLVTHGHTWPEVKALSADLIVMGHNHFTVEFREETGVRKVEPVWVVTRWDPVRIAAAYLRSKKIAFHGDPLSAFRERFGTELGSSRIIIMPAFNPMLGGMRVNRASGSGYISPILASGGVDIEGAEFYLLDHTFLGRTRDLRLLSEVDEGNSFTEVIR